MDEITERQYQVSNKLLDYRLESKNLTHNFNVLSPHPECTRHTDTRSTRDINLQDRLIPGSRAPVCQSYFINDPEYNPEQELGIRNDVFVPHFGIGINSRDVAKDEYKTGPRFIDRNGINSRDFGKINQNTMNNYHMQNNMKAELGATMFSGRPVDTRRKLEVENKRAPLGRYQ
jgi:hypothetical protein